MAVGNQERLYRLTLGHSSFLSISAPIMVPYLFPCFCPPFSPSIKCQIYFFFKPWIDYVIPQRKHSRIPLPSKNTPILTILAFMNWAPTYIFNLVFLCNMKFSHQQADLVTVSRALLLCRMPGLKVQVIFPFSIT